MTTEAAASAAPEASGPLLEVRGLEVRFAGRKGAVARAVDGVDLAVREGEVLALVGESGLWQDDAGAHDHGPRAAGGRRGVVPGRAAALRRDGR